MHGQAHGPEHYYPVMKLEDIQRLHIPSDDDCWLLLWATAAKLPEAITTLEKWGFKYRTCAIWDKWHLGLGWFFRTQHEILLIGKKGKPVMPAKKVRSIFLEKRTIHSRKPKCVRKWIDEAFPTQSKLELFAREKTTGWDVWGNEVESDIML
jgi:N6-adenosine-specific RNA methylase IME4